MKKKPYTNLTYLKHILESIEKIEKFMPSKRKFMQDEMVQDAIVRNLQIMSESTQKLSKSLKLHATDIPWHSLAGFRNALTHDYLGIDLDEIYQTIKSDLPKLKKRVKKMVEFVEKNATIN